MTEPKSVRVTPELHEYAVAHGTPPDKVQRSLDAVVLPIADGLTIARRR